MGATRGAENRPSTDAETLDDIEHRVVELIETHKQDAHSIYLEHLHTYDERLTALNFEERFAIIQQAAPESVGEFRAEAALGRDELFSLRRRLYDSEQERDDFRRRHRLARPARLSSQGKTLLKVGILAILFVIEVVINGNFLAKSNPQGLLGGAVQAVSFAALNIIASFLLGLVPIRLINRRNFFFKLIGLLSFLLYLAFAIGLNLTLAHLREIPPTVNGDVGQEVMMQLLKAPLVLNDIISWVFFGIGFIFSLIAMTDGLLFTDPYFGYALAGTAMQRGPRPIHRRQGRTGRAAPRNQGRRERGHERRGAGFIGQARRIRFDHSGAGAPGATLRRAPKSHRAILPRAACDLSRSQPQGANHAALQPTSPSLTTWIASSMSEPTGMRRHEISFANPFSRHRTS